jgi:hypothetical protein
MAIACEVQKLRQFCKSRIEVGGVSRLDCLVEGPALAPWWRWQWIFTFLTLVRIITGSAVFALGILAGAGFAAWLMPPPRIVLAAGGVVATHGPQNRAGTWAESAAQLLTHTTRVGAGSSTHHRDRSGMLIVNAAIAERIPVTAAATMPIAKVGWRRRSARSSRTPCSNEMSAEIRAAKPIQSNARSTGGRSLRTGDAQLTKSSMSSGVAVIVFHPVAASFAVF